MHLYIFLVAVISVYSTTAPRARLRCILNRASHSYNLGLFTYYSFITVYVKVITKVIKII